MRRVANASTAGAYVIPMAVEGAVTMKTQSGDESPDGDVPYPRSDAESEVRELARSSPARPMRGALPAFRRDGSSFYVNLVRLATSSGAHTPAAAAQPRRRRYVDNDDDIIDEDAAMADDPASDNEGSEKHPRESEL
ncbi:hypothetical protein FRB90_002966 [Tulasnella sp. 427]|nr:hypothetical protein FRB90_002966 [Tulasnella sp. 427]